MIKETKLYSATDNVSLGEIIDTDLPVLEPINLYEIKNAYISSFGYIFYFFNIFKDTISHRHKNVISFKNIFSAIFLKNKIKINTPCISISNGWYDSYYHFTLECLPKLFLMRDYVNTSTVIFPSKHSSYHKQWFKILGVNNIKYINENEVVKTTLALSTTFAARDLNHHTAITPEFRNWVLSKIENKESVSLKKILIGRSKANYRTLVNNNDVIQLLTKYGFTYVEMEDFSVEEQIKLFYNAEQIVSVHGAALTNIAFCKPDTNIVDLMHNDFKQLCFLKLAIVLKLKYHIVRCAGKDVLNKAIGHDDLIVDLTLLESVINKW